MATKITFDPSTDPRVQEALSRKYGNDVVILLPLKREQDTIAVFNSGRQLCGFITLPDEWSTVHPRAFWEDTVAIWHQPTTIEPTPAPKATLDDLELL